MPGGILYAATVFALIAAWRRLAQPVGTSAAIVLVLLPLCFTGGALLRGRVYAPIDAPHGSEPLRDYAADHGVARIHNATLSDLYTQMIPWQHAVRQSLLRGEWPLWNPHLLCGTVLAANMQSTVYDPLHLLALVLTHPQALTFGAAMTFFLAGFFTFAFARALGLGVVPSLIAAAGYMFCAPLAFFVGWPLGRAWALLPFVLVAVRFVVHAPGLRAAVLLTAALVLALVSGHPETVLHLVTIGAVYGAFELVETRRYRALSVAVLSGVVALLLTAVVLLPFFEAAGQTAQHVSRQRYYARQELPVTAEMVAQRAAISVFPWYGGQPERGRFTVWEPTNVRIGGVVLALALAALLLAPRRDTLFLAGLAVAGVWVGLNAPPFAQTLHAMPVFDITLNERLVFAGAFGLAMLAGMAVDAWPRARSQVRATAALVVAITLGLGLGTVWLHATPIAGGVSVETVRTLALADLVPLAVLALLLVARIPRALAAPAVLALVLLQRTIVDGGIYPALPASMFYPRVPLLAHLQDDRSEPFRIVGLHDALVPDTAALYGLEDARGYEAMTLLRLFETYPRWSEQIPVWFNKVSDPSRPFLSFLNVKYAIAGHGGMQPSEQWRLVREDRGSRLLENTRVLSRAFVPPRVRLERDPHAILVAMARATDFAETAWILAPAHPAGEVANGPGVLRIRRDGTGFDIDATMERDGWVVISEAGWRGWQARIDGRPAPLHDANHAFLAVHVPSGAHRLQLVYRPESFVLGRTISALAVVALLIGGAAWRFRRRERPGAGPPG